MFRVLPIVLLEIQLHLITALFTVEVLQPHYSANHGSDVIMGCCFPVHSPLDLTSLSVSWQRKLSELDKEVYKLNKGQEDLTQQDSAYRGRAAVLHEELKKGHSLLHITNVKLTDAGTYVCVVDYEGADYKYITLEVEAPYKRINLQERTEEGDLILTCHSEGYPLAEVSWYNERNPNVSMPANTTHELTNDGLFNIMSILRVKQSIHENYSCVFWNKKLNEKTSAHRPEVLLDKTDPSITGGKSSILFILPICLLALFLLTALVVVKVQKRKRFTNLCTQKGKRKKWRDLSKRDLDLQTKNLSVVAVTD